MEDIKNEIVYTRHKSTSTSLFEDLNKCLIDNNGYCKQSNMEGNDHLIDFIQFVDTNNTNKRELYRKSRYTSNEQNNMESVSDACHTEIGNDFSILDDLQNQISNKESHLNENPNKQEMNEKEFAKLLEDKDNKTQENNHLQRNNLKQTNSQEINLRKSSRNRSVHCLEVGSNENETKNIANGIKKKSKNSRNSLQGQQCTQQCTQQQVVRLQKQVCMLQKEIAWLRSNLIQPSTDLPTGLNRSPSIGEVVKTPMTPQSDSSTPGSDAIVSKRKRIPFKKYSCPSCTRVFASYGHLCRHVSSVHLGKKPYTCKLCNESFSLANQLRVHKVIHSGQHSFKLSPEEFTNGDDLKSHMTICQNIKMKECKVCGKKFSRSCHLSRHLLIHSGIRPFSCKACGKKFYKSDHLTRHMITHTGKKAYHCDQCHKRFVTNSDLNTHKMSHSGERPFMCDVCGLRFIRHSHMVRHSKVHTGEKPYYCNNCGRSFARLNHLQRHQKLHVDDQTFKCYVCSSEHVNKDNLREHVLTHDTQKLLPCPWCSFEFNTHSKLSKHAKLQHQQCANSAKDDEKHSRCLPPKYVCDQCHKSYKTSGALVVHKRSHSGERPYICDVCALSFSRSSSLIRHRRAHTGEKPHVCQICRKAFARRHLLSRHVTTTHDDPCPVVDDEVELHASL